MDRMSRMKRLLRIVVLVMMLVTLDFTTAQGGKLPDSAYVYGVVGHGQSYSISCEARSAADLAAYWGFDIGETEFLNAMPRSDNPDEGFVGSPDEVWGRLPPNGYGVHAGPVAETLRDFGLKAFAHRDLGWDDLRREINAGRPVILWVIGAMWPGTLVDYQAEDGSTARVAIFEHTMLLTGYTANSVEVINAGNGQYEYYSLSTFLESWSVLGNMAVFASPGSSEKAKPATENHGNTYTVQPGDYLIALARRFGVSWQELAGLNSITYPYVIYKGQVLQLPAGEVLQAETAPESEIVPTEPKLTPKIINFRSRLPLVQRNSTSLKQSDKDNSLEETAPEMATVQRTETLIDFGRSIGVAWHVLARLNNLPGTHILYPGEVLRVR